MLAFLWRSFYAQYLNGSLTWQELPLHCIVSLSETSSTTSLTLWNLNCCLFLIVCPYVSWVPYTITLTQLNYSSTVNKYKVEVLSLCREYIYQCFILLRHSTTIRQLYWLLCRVRLLIETNTCIYITAYKRAVTNM